MEMALLAQGDSIAYSGAFAKAAVYGVEYRLTSVEIAALRSR
jgi:hypothetical protein